MLGCCLLMAVEAGGARSCYAQSQEQPASASPSAKQRKVPDNDPPELDSSSRFSQPPAGPADYDNSLGLHLIKNIALDQTALWTSPRHLRLADADWLVPLGMVLGGTLATDTAFSKSLSNSPGRIRYSNDLANYGVAGMAAAGGGLYLWGRMAHDDHKSEAGILAGEAAIDSFSMVYGLKYAFGRERPLAGGHPGTFWSGGDSFPSEHAAAAWSIASVIAHEYPGHLTQLLAYGAATAISMSRVSGKQHFPSDVLAGSAIGWFVGQEVYRHHHNPELGGGEWQTYAESREERPDRRSTSVGSPYVELDSWIYPAIERLAALGYIHSEFLGMRPWTRIECAQLVQEAGDAIQGGASVPQEADRVYSTLAREFSGDLDGLGGSGGKSVRLESVYARATDITGPPLHDSYHFGQTINNDYGRPYEEGFNAYDGFSGYGTAGRFTIYVRGEYQHAPFSPAYSLAVRQAISAADLTPVQPATPFSTTNQFRLLDTYVAAKFAGWNLSFGKQSLWWGPGEGGAFLFSDNAEPIYMFRASRVAPFRLPGVFRWLGPMKWDAFFGKLSGNEFPPRALIHGEKISFKPTPNLELGFSRTVEMGGVGRPLTLGHLWLSYFSLTSPVHETPNTDPGKRTGGFDLSYRVPFLRKWLTVYTDSLADDDPSPLANPPRAAINPGIYISRLPGVPKLDFRVESVYTNTPRSSQGGHYVYWDSFYRDLYTNKGNIIGSWVGREGSGLQAWTTYWFTSRDSLQFGYRHAKVAKDFIPAGETVNDGSVKINCWVHNDVSLSGAVQYERWFAPILAPSPQTNWTSSVQITFYPHSWSW